MLLQSSSSLLHQIRTHQESPKSCPPRQPGAHYTANPFFVQLPTTCPTRPTQPALLKNPILWRLVWYATRSWGPFKLSVRVESSNLQVLEVWYLRLTNIHPKLKLLRDPPIFKFSTAWACIKQPSSKWDIKGGMLLNKKAFMTSQRMLESPLASGPQNEGSSSWHPKPPHGDR